jgi:hypothetical protein
MHLIFQGRWYDISIVYVHDSTEDKHDDDDDDDVLQCEFYQFRTCYRNISLADFSDQVGRDN